MRVAPSKAIQSAERALDTKARRTLPNRASETTSSPNTRNTTPNHDHNASNVCRRRCVIRGCPCPRRRPAAAQEVRRRARRPRHQGCPPRRLHRHHGCVRSLAHPLPSPLLLPLSTSLFPTSPRLPAITLECTRAMIHPAESDASPLWVTTASRASSSDGFSTGGREKKALQSIVAFRQKKKSLLTT